MTREEFDKDFGPEWRKFSGKPIFAALLSLLETEHPIKTIPSSDGDRLHGASVYLNEAYGYGKCLVKLTKLSEVPPVEFDPPTTFKEPEKF